MRLDDVAEPCYAVKRLDFAEVLHSVSSIFSPIPRHQQLSNLLRERIASESLSTGDRFLSVRDISREYSVSMVTAHKSVQELVSDDMLVVKPAKGCFVGKAVVRSPRALVRPLITVLSPEVARGGVNGALPSEFVRGLRERIPAAQIRQEYLPQAQLVSAVEALLEREGDVTLKNQVFVLHSPDEQLKKLAVARQLPAVVFGSLERQFTLPSVQFDEYELAYTATCMLLAKDPARVFFLEPDALVYGNQLRRDGFFKALAEHDAQNAGDGEQLYVRLPHSEGAALAKIDRLMSKSKSKDRIAFVTGQDRFAAWAIRAASARGLRIPQDLMLVSLQGGELAEQLTPRLSSVRDSSFEVGISVGGFVERILSGEKIGSARHMISAAIVDRETT
jgi:DNA-binding LacI/PurR family transcriptional regulator